MSHADSDMGRHVSLVGLRSREDSDQRKGSASSFLFENETNDNVFMWAATEDGTKVFT